MFSAVTGGSYFVVVVTERAVVEENGVMVGKRVTVGLVENVDGWEGDGEDGIEFVV